MKYLIFAVILCGALYATKEIKKNPKGVNLSSPQYKPEKPPLLGLRFYNELSVRINGRPGKMRRYMNGKVEYILKDENSQ